MPDKLETCPACGRRANLTYNEYEGRALCDECNEAWDTQQTGDERNDKRIDSI